MTLSVRDPAGITHRAVALLTDYEKETGEPDHEDRTSRVVVALCTLVEHVVYWTHAHRWVTSDVSDGIVDCMTCIVKAR